jgi:5-methyltetrahydrofolate--homocysteine methyltransferase
VLGCNGYDIIDLGVMVSADKILQTAQEKNVDIVGLSGLITPSLDEMVHIAREMKRRNFGVPLIIGGATTSRMHTAVKIAPEYDNGVLHVLDASRSVTAAGSLLSKEQKAGFLMNIQSEYAKLKNDFGNKKSTKSYLPFEDAQNNGAKIDWENFTPVPPSFTGTKVFTDYNLEEVANYIDWQPFFIAWEMHGKFPQILTDKIIGTEATKLFNDAKTLLKKISNEKWLTAKGVVGFWPAISDGKDTVIVKAPSNSPEGGELVKLEFLRQQIKKAEGQPNLSLADFIKSGPSPQTFLKAEDHTKAPSRREGGSEFGYEWANPLTYGLLKNFAKQHRAQPTEAEEKLWELVKTKKLEGYKLRRQHIIGSYIADLVCLDKRLIVEIDGLIHQLPENKEADEVRTQWLNSIGFKIIRFTNDQVLYKTNKTIEAISSALKLQSSIKETNDLSSLFGGQGAEGADFIGAFAVTIHGIEEHIKNFEAQHDDYNKIILQALADRLAEALAELLHERTRKQFWGYATNEYLTTDELIEEKYRGIRPAPGYPACPDHTEKYKLFDLLDVKKNIDITLTESLAMYPASSVCGWYFAHPESKYFGIGKIEKDQAEDYAKRKGMPVEEIERWLRPNLEYDN